MKFHYGNPNRFPIMPFIQPLGVHGSSPKGFLFAPSVFGEFLERFFRPYDLFPLSFTRESP